MPDLLGVLTDPNAGRQDPASGHRELPAGRLDLAPLHLQASGQSCCCLGEQTRSSSSWATGVFREFGEGLWHAASRAATRERQGITDIDKTDKTAADAIRAAFAAHPRAGFLRAAERARADHDGPLPIGGGQTSSQPDTVDAMLRLLEVAPGMRVLDVGAGSGWTTALLAHLVGPTGEVCGVERVPELVRFGRANLMATHQNWASIVQAEPGVLGLPGAAPFDRILVSAEAAELPRALVDQLADGGLMVIPVAGVMLRVRRVADEIERSKHGYYAFVPLRDG